VRSIPQGRVLWVSCGQPVRQAGFTAEAPRALLRRPAALGVRWRASVLAPLPQGLPRSRPFVVSVVPPSARETRQPARRASMGNPAKASPTACTAACTARRSISQRRSATRLFAARRVGRPARPVPGASGASASPPLGRRHAPSPAPAAAGRSSGRAGRSATPAATRACPPSAAGGAGSPTPPPAPCGSLGAPAARCRKAVDARKPTPDGLRFSVLLVFDLARQGPFWADSGRRGPIVRLTTEEGSGLVALGRSPTRSWCAREDSNPRHGV